MEEIGEFKRGLGNNLRNNVELGNKPKWAPYVSKKYIIYDNKPPRFP